MSTSLGERRWRVAVVEPAGVRGRRHVLHCGDSVASHRQVYEGLAESAALREQLSRVLKEAPFDAYFFETPPVARSTWDAPFEFVVLDSPSLARATVDPKTFAERFSTAASAIRFSSLRGDAELVVPCPRAETPLAAYCHLATFVRGAASDEQHALWIEVARSVSDLLGDDPRWVSTSGLGVSWLHVRLDSRPKYYQSRDYARW